MSISIDECTRGFLLYPPFYNTVGEYYYTQTRICTSVVFCNYITCSTELYNVIASQQAQLKS